MKTKIFLWIACVSLLLSACSKDDAAAPNAKMNHVGQKWVISSLEFTVVDQSLSNPAQWLKNGTATNAGAFYFNGTQGSFDIVIDGKHTEDYFKYTEVESSISIVTVDQNISATRFSQNVINISGNVEGTTMSLSGTFTKQNVAQQYVFTGTFTLTKE